MSTPRDEVLRKETAGQAVAGTIQEMLARARDSFGAGRLPEAEQICREILEAEPGQPDALMILGVMAHNTGNYENAYILLNEANKMRPGDGTILFNFGIALRDLGRPLEALRVFQEASEIDPGFSEPLAEMALIKMEFFLWDDAHSLFDRAIALNPYKYSYWSNKAGAYFNQNKWKEAEACFEKGLDLAVSLDPHLRKLKIQLAISKMAGEQYHFLLKKFHAWLKPARYLEIGVATGQTLELVSPPTSAVGVDPEPKIQMRFPAPTEIVAKTSDDFFASGRAAELYGKDPVDFVFIDGLHIFEQVLKDFINVEKYSKPETVVLLHDTYPHDWMNAGREYVNFYWTGDVWKVIPCLKKYRPDLNIFTIPAKPTGLTVITGLDSGSTLLAEKFDEAVADFINLDYRELEKDREGVLSIGPSGWQEITQRIKKS